MNPSLSVFLVNFGVLGSGSGRESPQGKEAILTHSAHRELVTLRLHVSLPNTAQKLERQEYAFLFALEV